MSRFDNVIRGFGENAGDETREFYFQASETVLQKVVACVPEEVSRVLASGPVVPTIRGDGWEFRDASGQDWDCSLDRFFLGVPLPAGQVARAGALIGRVRDVVVRNGCEGLLKKVQNPEALHTTIMYRDPKEIVFVAGEKLAGGTAAAVREHNVRDLVADVSLALRQFRVGDQGSDFSFDDCATFQHPAYAGKVFTTAIVPNQSGAERIRALYAALYAASGVKPRTFIPHDTLIETHGELPQNVRDEVHGAIREFLAESGPFRVAASLRGWARIRLWKPESGDHAAETKGDPSYEFLHAKIFDVA